MFDLDDFFTRKETLLTAADKAAVECSDCLGCTNCCKELSESISLDSWDVALLKKGLGKSFDEMLECGYIKLITKNGVVVPAFGNKPDKPECIFLGDNGRCSIHPWRAGICRMYPLARLWQENGNFAYYLQRNECNRRSGKEILISEWLGYPDTEEYEATIKSYHLRLKKYREDCFAAYNDPEKLAEIEQKFFDNNFR